MLPEAAVTSSGREMPSTKRCWLKPPLPRDDRAQVGAGHVAHDDVEQTVVLADLVHRDHVRVLDPRREVRLALEAGTELGVLRELGGDSFSATVRSGRRWRAR